MISFNSILYPSGSMGFFCYEETEPGRLLIGWLPFASNYPGANFNNVCQYNCKMPRHFTAYMPMGEIRPITEKQFFDEFAKTGPDLPIILENVGYQKPPAK